MQNLDDQKQFLIAQMKQKQKQILASEGEYKSDEEPDHDFLIPAIQTKPTQTVSNKQKILMAVSENVFYDRQLFIYNNLW